MKKIVKQCVLLRRQLLLFDDRHFDLEFYILGSGNIICALVDMCWIDYFCDGARYEVQFAYKPRLMFYDSYMNCKIYRSELAFYPLPLAYVGGRNVNYNHNHNGGFHAR